MIFLLQVFFSKCQMDHSLAIIFCSVLLSEVLHMLYDTKTQTTEWSRAFWRQILTKFSLLANSQPDTTPMRWDHSRMHVRSASRQVSNYFSSLIRIQSVGWDKIKGDATRSEDKRWVRGPFEFSHLPPERPRFSRKSPEEIKANLWQNFNNFLPRAGTDPDKQSNV